MKNTTLLIVLATCLILTPSLQAKIIVKDPKKVSTYDWENDTSTITNVKYFWGQGGEYFIRFYFDDGFNDDFWLIGTKHNGFDMTERLQEIINSDTVYHLIIEEIHQSFDTTNGEYWFDTDGGIYIIHWANLIIERGSNVGYIWVSNGYFARQSKKERLAAPKRLQKEYQKFLNE